MRRKRGGYGMQESYAGYGLTAGRAKALLNECREGKSFDRMAVKWELGEAEMMPCCRNSFYAYRKFTLAILDDMLAGKEVGQDGQL